MQGDLVNSEDDTRILILKKYYKMLTTASADAKCLMIKDETLKQLLFTMVENAESRTILIMCKIFTLMSDAVAHAQLMEKEGYNAYLTVLTSQPIPPKLAMKFMRIQDRLAKANGAVDQQKAPQPKRRTKEMVFVVSKLPEDVQYQVSQFALSKKGVVSVTFRASEVESEIHCVVRCLLSIEPKSIAEEIMKAAAMDYVGYFVTHEDGRQEIIPFYMDTESQPLELPEYIDLKVEAFDPATAMVPNDYKSCSADAAGGGMFSSVKQLFSFWFWVNRWGAVKSENRHKMVHNERTDVADLDSATDTLSAVGIGEEKPIDDAEASRLNKILHAKLEEVQDAELQTNMRNDPRSPLYSNQSFEALELKKPIIDAIYEMGFCQPSKIQELSLPLLLGYPPKDLLAQSQSGTGKTASFLMTALHRINPSVRSPQCICLAPTFELAIQIGEVAKKIAKYMPDVGIRVLIKGENAQTASPISEQLIIGTPGKLYDFLVKFALIQPSGIICFVIDEADIMLMQSGYRDTSIRIHNAVLQANPSCQCLLFSATFTDDVFKFAETLIPSVISITLRRTDQSLPNIRQFMIKCKNREEKYHAILNLYNMLSIASSIIFCYTRSSANWLAEQIRRTGRRVGVLHGDMSAEERSEAVKVFRDGTNRVLITTNVCSRGLDIPQVKMVVNYDPPVTFSEFPQPDYDTYLHRIGRTGRFGKAGIAVNLVDTDKAVGYVKKFEEHFGRNIEEIRYDDYEKLDEIDQAT